MNGKIKVNNCTLKTSVRNLNTYTLIKLINQFVSEKTVN